MRGDEVAHDGWQLVLVGQAESVLHMLDDYLCATLVGQALVGILAVLVLGEEDGILQLADVVIERSCADELCLAPYFVGHVGCQVRHLHAVVESAVGLLRKPAQEGIVDVLQLDEGDDGGEAEDALDGNEQQVGQHGEYTSHHQEDIGPAADFQIPIGCAPHELHAEVGEHGGKGDDDCGTEEFVALRELAQGIDGHEACHRLGDDEDEGLGEHDRRSQDSQDVRHECCARIQEDAQHDGQHAVGHHIDTAPHVSHQTVRHNGEEEREAHDEEDGADAVEIVTAELLEVHEQQHDKDGGIDDSASDARHLLAGAQRVLLLVLFPGEQDVHHLVVHYLSPIHNLLPLQDNAHSAHQPAIDLLPLLLAFPCIVGKVRPDVFHKVKTMQMAVAIADAVLLGQKVLVGGLLAEELGEGTHVRLVAVIDAHLSGLFLAQSRRSISWEDAYRIDVAELLLEMRQKVVGNAQSSGGVEVLTECRQLLLLHVYVDMEVGLIELAQAVLLACHAVGRFQDGEAVLRDEGLLVPRLTLLVVVGRVVPKRHEDHQDDGGDKGKEDAVEVFPHTQFVLMIVTAHNRSSQFIVHRS